GFRRRACNKHAVGQGRDESLLRSLNPSPSPPGRPPPATPPRGDFVLVRRTGNNIYIVFRNLSRIEDLAQLHRQSIVSEWLLQKASPFRDESVPHDRVVGVPGHIEHLDSGSKGDET